MMPVFVMKYAIKTAIIIVIPYMEVYYEHHQTFCGSAYCE